MGNVSWAHGGGRLARWAERYGDELARLGFTRNSVITHVVLMGQLSRWMSEVGIVVGDLTEGRVERFFDSRRARGQRQIGHGSCRGRVEISVGAGSLKKKNKFKTD